MCIRDRINAEELGTEAEEESTGEGDGSRDWYAQLWDSIATPEELVEEKDPENEDHKLPTVPEEKPEQQNPEAPAPEQEPAPAAPEQAPAPAN